MNIVCRSRFDGYHPFPESYPGMRGVVNTGGGSVVWGRGSAAVPKVALDDVIDQATEGGTKRVRILKLDCEGAEWPILFTSRRLHLVEQICGEFHKLAAISSRSANESITSLPCFRSQATAVSRSMN